MQKLVRSMACSVVCASCVLPLVVVQGGGQLRCRTKSPVFRRLPCSRADGVLAQPRRGYLEITTTRPPNVRERQAGITADP